MNMLKNKEKGPPEAAGLTENFSLSVYSTGRSVQSFP
jgi:hypothetical protein